MVSDGNLHTLRGVAEYVYTKFCEEDDDELDDDDLRESDPESEGDDDGAS